MSALRPLILISLAAFALNACEPKAPKPAQPVAEAQPATMPDPVASDGGGEQSADIPLPGEAIPGEEPPPNIPNSDYYADGGMDTGYEPAPPVPSAPPAPPTPTAWSYKPQGEYEGPTGRGYTDRTVWAPDMCFPIADAAFANSQVYRPGGMHGGAGGQCSKVNRAYPWYDNFCEIRDGRGNPMCGGTKGGHQGQDIRSATCKDDTDWVVASEDGQVYVGSISVLLKAKNRPYWYRYLHMKPGSLLVHSGDNVKKGQKLGKVSNVLPPGGTTYHLHFEIILAAKAQGPSGGWGKAGAFVPPYPSLIQAYDRKMNGQACALP